MKARALNRKARALWPAALLLILGVAAESVTLAGVTSLLLDSEPGEPVGQGEFNFYTSDDGSLEVQDHIPSTAQEVHLGFRGPGSIFWSLNFTAPPGELLAVGVYENAVNIFPLEPGQPGLGVNGNSGFCLNTSGRFEVKQIGIDPNGVLEHFWATFEQTCSGAVLRGEVRFNADVPVILQAPSRRTIALGHNLSFGVQGLDALGNPVALGADGLPPGATFSDSGDGTGHFAWAPEPGQLGIYRLSFNGESAGGDTDLVYTRVEAIPDFDDFDHPITFTTLPFLSELFEPEVSRAADDPACPSPYLGPPLPPPFPEPEQGSVWYAFTPAEDGGVQVGFQASSVPVQRPSRLGLSVYTGERGALESRVCARSVARFRAIAGQTYHIKVDIPPSTLLTFSAVALPPPPANDQFGAATVVGTLPFSDALDTRGALTDTDEPRHCIPANGPGGVGPGGGGIGPPVGGGPGFGGSGPIFSTTTNVWYAYTASEDTRVTVDTSSSNYYYAQITAFSGAQGGLVPLGCHQSRFSFTAIAGRTYHVMIAGSSYFVPQSSFGDLLQVTFTGMPALSIQVAVDAVGAVDPRSGTALVHGTARCSRPAQVVVDGVLGQDRRQVRGNFQAVVACDGATPWRAEVIPGASRNGSRRFASGPAQVTVHAVGVPGDNPDDAAIADGRTPITLKAGPPR